VYGTGIRTAQHLLHIIITFTSARSLLGTHKEQQAFPSHWPEHHHHHLWALIPLPCVWLPIQLHPLQTPSGIINTTATGSRYIIVLSRERSGEHMGLAPTPTEPPSILRLYGYPAPGSLQLVPIRLACSSRVTCITVTRPPAHIDMLIRT
jgi:hypothetical protein